MIFDTDIIIWYMRGNSNAKALVDSSENVSISAVTYMELMQGMKNKNELLAFEKFLNIHKINVVHLNTEISVLASLYVKQFHLSDSMEMADALIAATCICEGQVLHTANDKHYKCVLSPNIAIFRP